MSVNAESGFERAADSQSVAIDVGGGAESFYVHSHQYIVAKAGEKPDDILSPDNSARWQRYSASVGRNLKRDESLWLMFDILPKDLNDEPWFLALRLGTLHRVTLYTENLVTHDRWASRSVGVRYPVKERYKSSRHPAFPLQLEEGQPLKVFVEIKSPNLVAIPLEIVQEHQFDVDRDNDLLILGAILGTLLVMSLYNLSLFLILKDKSYLYYTLYIVFALLYLTAMTGIGPYYFWTGHDWLTSYGLLTFASLCFLTATLFVRDFLVLRSYGGWVLHSNTVLLVIWSLFTLTFLISDNRILFNALGFMSLLTCVIGAVIAVYLSLKRSVPAMIFSAAWLALIFGTVVFSLMLEGVLPFNFFTAYSQIFGMMVELILLSFAVAYRIGLDRRQREQAQKDALDLAVRANQERSQRIEAQKKTLDLQKGLNEQLETQVTLRTKQYEDAMDRLEEANGNLLRLSMTDSLSKVSNRRCFDDLVVKEYRRACRHQKSMAIVLMDIDHFKAVNDTYGHGVGDQCIRHVAEALGRVVSRPGDLLARYGGEEFVYLLPETSEEQALIVAEKARSLIESLKVIEGDVVLSLTISIGVAAWVPVLEESYSAMIELADKALYEAKSLGRNRVEVLSPR